MLPYSLLMATTSLKEKELYTLIEKWARRAFGCFATSINKGTELGRCDVAGLRQAPGDHSAETDLICIEVKRGVQPFLNAVGQAVGYSVYGNYCYLADFRPDQPFSEVERGVAEQLGVGLIRIKRDLSVDLTSTARRVEPIQNFRLKLADQMGYVECSICRTFFQRSKNNRSLYDWDLLQRDNTNRSRVLSGLAAGKGLVFWPEDASTQDSTHNSRHPDGRLYNRRFACNTCSRLFVGP